MATAGAGGVQPEVGGPEPGGEQATAVPGPEAGAQGQGSPADGLYDLSQVPSHLHEHVLPVIKQIEGNVTKRFEEAANFRRQWEPYQDLGLDQFEPQAVEQLVAIGQLAQEPEQFESWLLDEAERRGLLEPEDGGGGEGLDDFGEQPPEWAAGLIERLDRLEQGFEPIAGHVQSQQEQAELQQTNEQVQAKLKELGVPDDARDRVLQLSLAYTSQHGLEALAKGYEDWKADRAAVERGVFDRQGEKPDPPETGGGQPVTPVQPPRSFDDASEAARAMVRRARAG